MLNQVQAKFAEGFGIELGFGKVSLVAAKIDLAPLAAVGQVSPPGDHPQHPLTTDLNDSTQGVVAIGAIDNFVGIEQQQQGFAFSQFGEPFPQGLG